MNIISKQIEKLRSTSIMLEATYGINSRYIKNLISEAADTIEVLSTKLYMENKECLMEQHKEKGFYVLNGCQK